MPTKEQQLRRYFVAEGCHLEDIMDALEWYRRTTERGEQPSIKRVREKIREVAARAKRDEPHTGGVLLSTPDKPVAHTLPAWQVLVAAAIGGALGSAAVTLLLGVLCVQ